MAAMVDHALTIGCTKTVPRIQEGHLVILHAICEAQRKHWKVGVDYE